MEGSPHDAIDAEPTSDLTLHEAADQYAVSARTLAQHIRCGQLPAYKATGVTGREWRVTRDALAAAGYQPRPPAADDDAEDAPLVAQLRHDLNAARRAAAVERRRAEDADRRLGHALLECGRLRAALANATDRQGASELDLTSSEARELVDAVRNTPTEPRLRTGGG